MYIAKFVSSDLRETTQLNFSKEIDVKMLLKIYRNNNIQIKTTVTYKTICRVLIFSSVVNYSHNVLMILIWSTGFK